MGKTKAHWPKATQQVHFSRVPVLNARVSSWSDCASSEFQGTSGLARFLFCTMNITNLVQTCIVSPSLGFFFLNNKEQRVHLPWLNTARPPGIPRSTPAMKCDWISIQMTRHISHHSRGIDRHCPSQKPRPKGEKQTGHLLYCRPKPNSMSSLLPAWQWEV